MITSKDNKIFKSLKKKIKGKGLGADSICLEGFRLCLDALESGFSNKVSVALFTYSFTQTKAYTTLVEALPQTVERYVFVDFLFEQLSDTTSPQGCILIINQVVHSTLDCLRDKPKARVLVLEQIQDPGNLGTMIRTANAFGFDAIIQIKGGVSFHNPKVIRSAMGAMLRLPVIVLDATRDCYSSLEALGFQIYACDLNGVDIDTIESAPDRLALVIGNEGNGLSAWAKEQANQSITIGMCSDSESLNAASAASILCYVFKNID